MGKRYWAQTIIYFYLKKNNKMRWEKTGDTNIKKLYFLCVFIFMSSLVLPDLPK